MIRRPSHWMRTVRASPMRSIGYGAQLAVVEVDMALGTVQGAPDHGGA